MTGAPATGQPTTTAVGPHEEAYARLVATADAAYTGSMGRAADLFGPEGLGDRDERLTELRKSSGEAARVHGLALDDALAALEPALTANTREIEEHGARDKAEGTIFTRESNERHDALVAERARLMIAAIAPGCYARAWHSEMMDSVARAAKPAHPPMG